jgi:type VI secretion system secreted protein VgrG
MATYTQANRPLSVTTPLGKDALLLVRFEGQEALSQLFHFHLELLAPKQNPVGFDKVVGQPIGVRLAGPGGGSRFFHGYVSRFGQGRRDENFTYCLAEMVPQLWFWTRKVNSRIFQHLSVPDILKQVLAGLTVTWELRGTYHPRDYCVQYRESDFAFASRLMEEEGIHYYFKHTESSHPLVVTDAPAQHPHVPAPSKVIYEEVLGWTHAEPRVMAWEKFQEVRSGVCTLWDHCFELPGKNLEARQTTLDTVKAGTVAHDLRAGRNDQLEIYDYPGAYAQRFDGVNKGGGEQPAELSKIFEDNRRTVKIRMEQETRPAVDIQGGGNCTHFLPGHQFALSRHFDADGSYLLTRVRHAARLPATYRSGEAPPFEYRNDFSAIPVGLPYRPPRVTPKPVLAGTQTATVVGPKGQEVFVDKYGRIKVQFPWDRQGKKDADSSCWIRVAQVWAGKGWGAFFWPRIGQEVVVAFEEGDPDRPIVVGSVYNAENMPPFAPPVEPLVNGIKSCSERGKPHKNFNALIFYDKPGQEHTQIHSENHHYTSTERGQHTHVGDVCARVVGSLPLMGSGSGGGQPQADPPEQRQPGSYTLHDDTTIFGSKTLGLALDLDLEIGYAFSERIGLSFDSILGGATSFCMDIFDWPQKYLPAGTANFGTFLGAAAGGLLGKTEIDLCTVTGLQYGNLISIQRGNSVSYQGTDLNSDPLALSLAAFTGLYPLVQIVLFLTVLDQSTDKNVAAKDADWFIYSLPWVVSEGILVGYERNNAVARILLEMTTQSAALTQQVAPVAATAPARKLSQAGFSDIIKMITGQVQKQISVDAKDDVLGNSDFQMVEGCLARYAHDIALVSNWQRPTDAPAGIVGILIDSQGSGPAKKDGILWVNATGTSLLTAGTACVALRNADKEQILIECNALGEICIHQGSPAASPKIELTPEGITLSVGPAVGPPLAKITMTQTAITLSFGAPQPIAQIKLGPNGIEFKVAEVNTVAITPKGFELGGLLWKTTGEIKMEWLVLLLKDVIQAVRQFMAGLNMFQ